MVKHKLIKIFGEAATYDIGMGKLDLALFMSDIESDDLKKSRHERHIRGDSPDDDIRVIRKRKHVQPIAVSDDENDEPSPRKSLLPSFPVIPSSIQKFRENMGSRLSSCYSDDTQYDSERNSSRVSTPASIRNDTNENLFAASEISQKLNLVLSKLQAIESRLHALESFQQSSASTVLQLPSTVEDLYKIFPLANNTHIDNFEKELQVDSYFNKMVNELTTIGGSDVQSLTVNILKKILTNKVANEYSLDGKKKKKVFKNFMYRLIINSVRCHRSNATEVDISNFVAVWLTQSGLRLARELGRIERTLDREPLQG